MTALAMGPGCNADLDDPRGGEPLEAEDGARGERPQTGSHALTTQDHDAAVPGFEVTIALGGDSGEDVVLDWSGSGYAGEAIVYRSTDATALLELLPGEPLAPGIDSELVLEQTSYIDPGAASSSVETPHYFYRVAFVDNGEFGSQARLSTMVMKTTTATAPGFNNFGICMLDGPDSAADLYAQMGASMTAAWFWDAGTQAYINWSPGGGVDFPIPYGSSVVAQFDGTVAAYHSLVGVVPTHEAMAVTGQPGDNWTTIPVFFDGPTAASYWVDVFSFWGVGDWDNLAQNADWYWGPAYPDFEFEPCGTYIMHLPPHGCASDADCDPDLRCYFDEGGSCGESIAGVCLQPPASCEGVPADPVCGCDGTVYDSPCDAYAAGSSVRSPGSMGGGGGTVVFDFEGESPVLEATGDWQLYGAAPPSYDLPETPFPSQVLGTDGNRIAPYPGDDSEDSAATIGPITLGESLLMRSWHVDEGGDYYDRKRIYFEAETGESWLLADCTSGVNLQAFCNFRQSERAGDDWDEIVFDTAVLAGQSGTLRFEYETLDDCCSFEQGWFLDDIAVGGCGAQVTSGPPIPAPDPEDCPAVCLDMAMFQQLVLDPNAGPIDGCFVEDFGTGGNAQIDGLGGFVSVNWEEGQAGQCESSSPESGFESLFVTNIQAEACAELIEAQIANLGLMCGEVF
ncbi:MAG: hypothetical protein K0V04_13385 [Deltaproteobacteria bacterium]|nr:hypothetical protein [Deltaproteobacteria bacterium]